MLCDFLLNVSITGHDFTGQSSVTAQGGDGGIGVKAYCGASGGLGRVRVEAEILHGTPTSEQAAVTTALKERTFIV